MSKKFLKLSLLDVYLSLLMSKRYLLAVQLMIIDDIWWQLKNAVFLIIDWSLISDINHSTINLLFMG